ncbi:SAM-dependent methyltransferase [Legionella adelaidensis]|uniref:Ribosomal RNA small subunit methyltransferase J n=1 Tax=Legionella adelaidensis TaxID=45056 RepID=A0A0W0R3B6_9GAMM|nr:class I SAM-dependent methyltransferase [Legionella adelaidensis]KTC65565.1 SAM-dependent methyltransferase [Legionella adelaidensis]
MTFVSIGYDNESLAFQAKTLAKELNSPIDNSHFPRIQIREERLELLVEGFSPLFVDFNSSLIKKRQQAGKNQGLIQACKPGKGLRIIDATAGWGKDAAILASFGANVLMLERNPVMSLLLEDGLKRLPTSTNLSLISQDARVFLLNLPPEEYPDLIYIDPMHPERQKSALVKKEMQVLQHIIGTDQDAQELIEIARNRCNKKVVVKWPQKLPAKIKPSYSIEGKTIRFDIYTRAL